MNPPVVKEFSGQGIRSARYRGRGSNSRTPTRSPHRPLDQGFGGMRGRESSRFLKHYSIPEGQPPKQSGICLNRLIKRVH